jgi:hypothetical protein
MNDHLLNDQDYEAYVLSIGEYDERVFLGEDAPDEIGTPAKVPYRIALLSLLLRIAGSVVDPHHVDADPDSTYHPDADPDADLDSDFLLMRIRIPLFTLMRILIQIFASKKGSNS